MRSCPQCHQILADSAGHCPEDGRALSAPDARIGQLLSGQFRVLERIGQGASGEVYRAWQVGIERNVAIKVLSASAASSSEFVARFVREAQAAARLTHASIITVYHVGTTSDGLPFMAMEWIDGSPIGKTRDGGLSGLWNRPDEVIALAKQIASALAAAHAVGIIHRDLKPDNLLVSSRQGRPVVTILDFGIAKFLDEALLKPGETHLTQLGTVYGTPRYLSPEQACGKTVDARSDLYSLGVMLYELVSGRLPFTSSGVALLVEHLNVEAPDLQEKAPGVPPALASLIMRLLAKRAEDRPQSAEELLLELENLTEKKQAPRPIEPTILMTQNIEPTVLMTQHIDVAAMPASRPRRRASVSLGAAVLAIMLLAFSSGHLDMDMQASSAHGVTTEEVQSATEMNSPSPDLQGPKRALMVSAQGYALRVLLPEDLRAERDQTMAIEVWDPAGRPLALPALVVLFADGSGEEQGVNVPSSATRGRYELTRRFEHKGQYSMQVLTEDADVALRVHFEVRQAASPNS
jgi:serine/threonine protein kinase